MTVSVTFIEDAADQNTWETVSGGNAAEIIRAAFPVFPERARIYHEQIALTHDVTPTNPEGVNRLTNLTGNVYVFAAPGDPLTAAALIIGVIAVAAAFLLTPPVPTLRNSQSESPNNSLSGRSNSARLNGRIPDIYGTVRSTPDLIQRPYSVFVDHEEIEFNYMCIGRGRYFIEAGTVQDGDTPILQIDGASVEVFEPFTSPMSGDTPLLRIGSAISEPLYTVFKSNAVNGQTLKAPNDKNLKGRNNVVVVTQGFATLDPNTQIFSDEFEVGDQITVTGSVFDTDTLSPNLIRAKFNLTNGSIIAETASDMPSYAVNDTLTIISAQFVIFGEVGGNPDYSDVEEIDLAGTYTVVSQSGGTVVLQDPDLINAGWDDLADFYGTETPFREVRIFDPNMTDGQVSADGVYEVSAVTATDMTVNDPGDTQAIAIAAINALFGPSSPRSSLTIQSTRVNWVGPFVIDNEVDALLINLVANQGMFKDDGEAQISTSVQCEIEYSLINADGSVTSGPFTNSVTVSGSSETRDQRAVTARIDLLSTSRVSVRLRRITLQDLNFEGSVVDEVKVRDMFGLRRVTETHFGDVTTVHSKTRATASALAVKERKLNMEVTRKIPRRVSGTTFTDEQPTIYAADIMVHAALDPLNGRMTLDEIDLDSLYGTLDEVDEYFGGDDATSFCYTFDSDNLSFQDMFAAMAGAVFCQSYRQAEKLQLISDLSTEDASLLFNHRNKLPRSEVRKDRFGPRDDHDGVSLEWVDPDDDAIIALNIPSDQSAVQPNRVETIGVRNQRQAYYHAWRAQNRITFENGAIEFDATQEAELLPRGSRILCADNTRALVQDGDIEAQDGLTLTTSHDVTFTPGADHIVYLQLPDASIQAIRTTEGSHSREIILTEATRLPLSVDPTFYARATYLLTDDAYSRSDYFRINQVSLQDDLTCRVDAVIDSPLFYQNDAVELWLRGAEDIGPRAFDYTPSGGAVFAAHDGRSDALLLSSSGTTLDLTEAVSASRYSLCIWLHRAAHASRPIIRHGAGFLINLSDTGVVSVTHDGVTSAALCTVPAGAWTHLTLTYDGTESHAFLTGQHIASEAIQAPILTGSLEVAADGFTSTRAADVRFYSRALSPSDVNTIYHNTKAGG